MTQVFDYNKRCAEFLGKEYNDNRIVTPYSHFSGQNPTGKVWEECKFHSDWNWIMEVVEAIDGNVKISKGYCRIITTDFDITINAKTKEAVVQAINQFLIWYNEKNI